MSRLLPTVGIVSCTNSRGAFEEHAADGTAGILLQMQTGCKRSFSWSMAWPASLPAQRGGCCARRPVEAEVSTRSAHLSVEQDILRSHGVREKRLDVWQRAVDTLRFHPRFRSDGWRRRITGGHPDRVVLTYVGRLGAGQQKSCSAHLLPRSNV